MDAATVVADAVVVEITEDAAMDAVETAATAVDAAEMDAAAGITGDGAAPVAGTGIPEKLSVMDSGKVMMPDSAMDSGKDGTMTAGLADRVALEVRDAQVMAAIPAVDAASFYF